MGQALALAETEHAASLAVLKQTKMQHEQLLQDVQEHNEITLAEALAAAEKNHEAVLKEATKAYDAAALEQAAKEVESMHQARVQQLMHDHEQEILEVLSLAEKQHEAKLLQA